MQDKKIINAVRRYLKNQQISNRQIQKDLQIDISGEEELSSHEFLTICAYLRMPPQYFMTQMGETLGEKSYDSV